MMTPGPARPIVTVLPRNRPTPMALPMAIIVSWRGFRSRCSPSSVAADGGSAAAPVREGVRMHLRVFFVVSCLRGKRCSNHGTSVFYDDYAQATRCQRLIFADDAPIIRTSPAATRTVAHDRAGHAGAPLSADAEPGDGAARYSRRAWRVQAHGDHGQRRPHDIRRSSGHDEPDRPCAAPPWRGARRPGAHAFSE